MDAPCILTPVFSPFRRPQTLATALACHALRLATRPRKFLAQKEAERRTFYVAFTRARRRVLMLVRKQIDGSSAAPSPYIAELGLSIVDDATEEQLLRGI